MRADDVLVRYLLGTLPEAEAERLEEQSVADDAVAQRLEAVENDLVDDYVRGTLNAGMRTRFEAHYLSTSRGRQKLRFAQALLQRSAAPATKRAVTVPHLPSRWLLAAAALVLAVTGTVLIVQQTSEPETPTPEVARQPAPVAPPPPGASVEPPAAPTVAPTPVVVAFALPPARRGIVQPPDVSIPAGATEVLLRLELEGDHFPEYAAVVKEAATGRILHEAPRLRSSVFGQGRVVPVSVPASSLPSTRVIVELTGRKPGEGPEPLSTYPFRVIAR